VNLLSHPNLEISSSGDGAEGYNGGNREKKEERKRPERLHCEVFGCMC